MSFPDSEVIGRAERSRIEPREYNHYADCPADQDIMADCDCFEQNRSAKYDASEIRADAEREG